MKSLFIILSLIYSAQSQSCQDFSNGLCPMEESNIISSDLNIWSPDECQALCMYVVGFVLPRNLYRILHSEMRTCAISFPMLEVNVSWLTSVTP